MSHVSSLNSEVPALQNYIKKNNPIRYQGGVEGTEEKLERIDNAAEERAEISTVTPTNTPVNNKGININTLV